MPTPADLWGDRAAEASIITACADDTTLAQRLYDQTGLDGTHLTDAIFSRWLDHARTGEAIDFRPGDPPADPFGVAAVLVRRHEVRLISMATAELDRLRRGYVDGKVSAADLREAGERVRQAAGANTAQADTPTRTLSDLLDATLIDVDRRHTFRTTHGHSVFGAPSGFSLLDSRLYGFQAGTMTLVGAPPGAGKTTMLTQVAEHAAVKGSPALYCSFENDPRSLMRKILARRAGCSMFDLDGGVIGSAALVAAAEGLRQSPGDRLEIMEGNSTTTLAEIGNRTAALAARHRSEATPLLVIDYLQRLSMVEFGDMEERRAAVSRVSVLLAGLAKQLNVAIIAITSLNREGYNDPKLTSSKESGDLDFDADAVLMLHRLTTDDEFEKAKRTRPVPPVGGSMTLESHEIRIVKNRHGPTGTVPLLFEPSAGRFAQEDVVPTTVSFGSNRRAAR